MVTNRPAVLGTEALAWRGCGATKHGARHGLSSFNTVEKKWCSLTAIFFTIHTTQAAIIQVGNTDAPSLVEPLLLPAFDLQSQGEGEH